MKIISAIILAVLLVYPCYAQSPDNTRVPPAQNITVADPIVWKLGPQDLRPASPLGNFFIQRNGVGVGGASGSRIALCSGIVYVFGRNQTWYIYTKAGLWQATGLTTIPCDITATIDVTAYGAVPDDSNDDSAAIQKAIDAAPNRSTIYFPKGTYLVSNLKLNNRSGLTLSGDGSTLSILRRSGSYPNMFESTNASDLLVTKLGFDANGIVSYGGFVFYDAKRITITRNHFFDSNKQPPSGTDRYSWVFGHGGTPSEDIIINDNLIQDLQLEVDFGLRVRIEGNTVLRPVATAGIGVFSIGDNTPAVDYTIQKNTIVDPVVSGGGIAVHLDPPNNNNVTMRGFRILDNIIIYTKDLSGSPASAIRLGTGNNSQATTGNIFDNIIIQNNAIYKDPSGPEFGDINAIIFGNSSPTANFKFNNTNVSNNRIYYNGGMLGIDIREKGANYVESNNIVAPYSPDAVPQLK